MWQGGRPSGRLGLTGFASGAFTRSTPTGTPPHVACPHDPDCTAYEPPARLDARGGAGTVRAALHRARLPGRGRAPAVLRSSRGADLDVVVDQDRRLPGGLRLLLAIRQVRHRREGREADGPRR